MFMEIEKKTFSVLKRPLLQIMALAEAPKKANTDSVKPPHSLDILKL